MSTSGLNNLIGRRILGPNHVRILTVVPDAQAQQSRRGGAKGYFQGGAIDSATAAELLIAGWTIYEGPALADSGWVTDTKGDTTVRPHPTRYKRNG